MENRRPISERKLQANRANAKKSTGPKTSAGKAAVRRNALKHGLRSNMLSVRPDECTERFKDMLMSIESIGESTTIEEETLLQEIARLVVEAAKAGSVSKVILFLAFPILNRIAQPCDYSGVMKARFLDN